MSFLSILLFTSAFYFVHGRPDTTAMGESSAGGYPSLTPTEGSSDVEASPMKEQLDAFMQEMTNAIEKYLTPMMSALDKNKQEEMKAMAINGCYSYVNYVILTLKENHNKNDTKNGTNNSTNKFTTKRDDIIIEFESLGPMSANSGFIPEAKSGASPVTEAKSEAVDVKKDMPLKPEYEAEAE